MVEADAFQSRQRGALHARRPRQEAASLGCNAADDPPPDRAGGDRAPDSGTRSRRPARGAAADPATMPASASATSVSQPGIGDIQPVRRPQRAGRRAATAGHEPMLLAAPDRLRRSPPDRPPGPATARSPWSAACRAIWSMPASAVSCQPSAGCSASWSAVMKMSPLEPGTKGGATHTVSNPIARQRAKWRRPIRQIACYQRMQMIDLWCHAVVIPLAQGGSVRNREPPPNSDKANDNVRQPVDMRCNVCACASSLSRERRLRQLSVKGEVVVRYPGGVCAVPPPFMRCGWQATYALPPYLD